MELRQLEYFVAVAEEGHFTRAAGRLHIVQSGLSASVQKLERELGAPLFVRSPQRVELTALGQVFLVEARRTRAAAREAQDAAAAVQGLFRGTLSVGVHPHQRRGVDVAVLLGQFHARYPGVELYLHQAVSAVLLEEVHEGRCDLALAVLVGTPPAGVSTHRLGGDALVLVCHPDHPLAGRQRVELAELADQAFVTLHTGRTETGTLVDELFDMAQIKRRIAAEVNDMRFLLALVAQGLGVAVVPEGDAAEAVGVGRVPLQATLAQWELVVATLGSPPASRAARALLELTLSSTRPVSPP